MNRLHLHAFDVLDEPGIEMTHRLMKLLNGETDPTAIAGEDAFDADERETHFPLH